MLYSKGVLRFVAFGCVVAVFGFMAGALLYPFLIRSDSDPVLDPDSVIIRKICGPYGSYEYGPQTAGARILLGNGEMIQLPEDAHFQYKVIVREYEGREHENEDCDGEAIYPAVPYYRIIRDGSEAVIDANGRIFLYGAHYNSEYFRRFGFLKVRLPPDRTPEGLEYIEPEDEDNPCVRLKCEWWRPFGN